jgi:Response regulator of the LytR/AlgR family
MKVLVVEEEQQIVRKLERVFKSMDGSIRIIGTPPAMFSSTDWMKKYGAPDIVLVNKNILQRLDHVFEKGVKATVTFTWQQDQFAFQAFIPPAVTPGFRNRFLVKQGQRFASILTPDIAYFFSDGRFIFFKTYDNQKYLVEYTLEELESMLDPEHFFRINRSLLIAFKSVAQIHPYFGNRLKLILEPPMEKDIIVSREKVGDFKAWLGK